LRNCVFVCLFFVFFACQYEKKDSDIQEAVTENKAYDSAWYFYEKKENNEAYFYFNVAKEYFIHQKNSIQAAKCLVNMAYISNNKSDFFGAQELTVEAIQLLNPKIEKEREVLSSAYNSLGQSIHELGNYSEAIEYYKKSIEFTTDSVTRIINQNNIANSYRYNKQYTQAIQVYQKLINQKETKKNPKEFARILDNLAFTKWLQNKNQNIEAELNKALSIRVREKDLFGQNASYAHLIDYLIDTNPQKALLLAYKRKHIAFETNSVEDKLEVLQQLILLEQPIKAKEFFVIHQKLNDSIQLDRSNAKNQFALMRYESEKHKTDYLRVEAENEKKKNDILTLYLTVILLLFCLIIGYLFFRKRKQKLEQENRLKIKNTELKYSKKVHDKVANRIYQILSEVENNPVLNKNELLDKLENVYEISRDISYEKNENDRINFAEKLSDMMSSYSSDEVEFYILGNENELWEHCTLEVKNELYEVIQELLTNMKKHSQASRVVLNFSQKENEIKIKYSDNGIGVKEFQQKNGLQNTVSRIFNINGTLIFDTENKEGFKAQISFPISKIN